MKQLLLLCVFLASLTVYAQQHRPTNKILIGFNFSPDYSFRTVKGDNSSAANAVIPNREHTEIAKFGYTTGINVLFNSNKLVAFETGIQYSNKGYKTKNQNLYFPNPGPNLPLSFKTNYTYQYIGVPLKARFVFGKSKLRLITSAGVMTNFLLNVKSTFTYNYSDGNTETHKTSTTSNFNKIDIAPMVSIGVDYKINNKFHFIAEPTFRYGLIKTIDAPVCEKLWSAGINVGLYCKIK